MGCVVDANKVYKNRIKPPKEFHHWCLKKFPVYKWSNKEKTIQSKRKMHGGIVEKRLTKNSFLRIENVKYYSIVLTTETKIEVQTYCYDQYHDEDGTEHIEHYLWNMEVFGNNQVIRIGLNHWYYGGYSTSLNRISMMSGPYTNVELYPFKDFQNSELKYIQDIDKIYIAYLSRVYKYRDRIEFLQKIGGDNMAAEIISGIGSYLNITTKKFLKKHKAYIKQNNPLTRQLILKTEAEKRGGKIIDGIDKCLTVADFKRLPKEVGIIKMQNYVIKHKDDFHYYFDYLKMMEELNIPKDENNLLPKDLRKAHDDLVTLINKQKDEEKAKLYNKDYKKVVAKLLKYELSIDDYCFVIPKKINEIIKEGKTLHHCVGTDHYLEKHAKNQIIIVFVRKKEDVQKPYYTMEFDKKNIVQLRGKNNQSADEELNKISQKWLKIVTERGFNRDKEY